MKPHRHILGNQKGAYFMMSAIVLSVMVGFAALGVEIGRWYGIQAEISKSIDGAAFAGAKNVSNPLFQDANGNSDPAALEGFVEQVATANFPPGLLGTDTPTFTAVLDTDGKVTVNGQVHSLNNLTTVFNTGTSATDLYAVGSAKLRNAEIVLVLDVSGSMSSGGAIDDLKTGATTFVENFQSFQKDHKFALIKYATGVLIPVPLQYDFVDPMANEISNLNPTGGTNIEDALGQAVTLPWATGQQLLPVNERTRQVVILFSDGHPSAFRAEFKYNGNDIDAVGLLVGSPPTNWYRKLGKPDKQWETLTSDYAYDHGDGRSSGNSVCGDPTTKWYIFQDQNYGISAYGSPMSSYSFEDCDVQQNPDFVDYAKWLVKQMALDHAAQLKTNGIEIYSIGLGSVDESFMGMLATDVDHAFFTNDAADLQGIFQTIANKLKLILVS